MFELTDQEMKTLAGAGDFGEAFCDLGEEYLEEAAQFLEGALYGAGGGAALTKHPGGILAGALLGGWLNVINEP